MMESSLMDIKQALITYGKTLPIENLFPTLVPEAAEFVMENPYAFCIAVCLDRGAKADVIWTIPYYMYKALGHLEPNEIFAMSLDDLANLFARLPKRPRYVNDAPQTVRDLTRIVIEDCGGDASKIWASKRARNVQSTFRSIHGVGPGIASMSVLLIEKAFRIRFDDPWSMDIKPDVHTKRVLYRLGVSVAETEVAAIKATRSMNPEYPGILDGALWEIGRRWCNASTPNCPACPMQSLCIKRL